MAINYTRLGTRWGHVIAALNEVNDYRDTTLDARVALIAGDFTSVNPSVPSDIYTQETAADGSFSGWIGYLTTLMDAILIAEVTNDRPIPSPSRSNCLVELDRQMRRDTESFQDSPCTLGTVTGVGSPVGDPQFVTTAKDGSGVVQDLIIPDSYVLRITVDEERGGTKWSEIYSIQGKNADNAPTDQDYPSGAGIDTTATILDPAKAIGLIPDPSFDNWTVTDTPDDWEIVVGVASTNIFKVTDDPRDGSDGSALRILSTANTSYKLRHDITSSVRANTVYGVHFKVKPVSNGTATASGITVTVRLVDGSGTVIADDAGTNNTKSSSTFAVVTPGSGWNSGYQTVFITPKELPSEVHLEIVFTADNSGADVYIDHVNLVTPEPLYVAGPYLFAFSGKTVVAFHDSWTWSVTLTSGTISGYIIRGLDRLINLRNEIRLPTASSPTISDGLIV